MKKIIRAFLIFIISTAVVFGNTDASYSYARYERDISILYATDSVPQEVKNTAYRVMQELPPNIYYGMQMENCIVTLYGNKEEAKNIIEERTSGNFNSANYTTFFMNDGMNSYTVQNNDCCINILAQEDPFILRYIMYHEIGHFVDSTHCGGFAYTGESFQYSTDDYLKEIYAKEKDALAQVGWASSVNVYKPASESL